LHLTQNNLGSDKILVFQPPLDKLRGTTLSYRLWRIAVLAQVQEIIDKIEQPMLVNHADGVKTNPEFVLAAIQAGLNYSQIARACGVTRERIRQIAYQHRAIGVESRVFKAVQRQVLLKELQEGTPLMMAAELARLPEASARMHVSKQGLVDLYGKFAERRRELGPQIELVRQGVSYWSAAGKNPASAGRLKRACELAGVKSRHKRGFMKGHESNRWPKSGEGEKHEQY
jgi:hypothetical protein